MNRVIRWTAKGIQMDADLRRQEFLISSEPRVAVTTPGVKTREQDNAEEEHAESYEESLSEDLRSLANQIVGRSGCAEHPSSWRRWP